VHFTRNAQALVPRGAAGMVASAIRSIFEQPDEHAAAEQLRRVADSLTARFPAVAELLVEAEPDLLVHFTFPETHRPRIRSTNLQERLNKEIKRRTAVVGIFPTRASLIRLVGMTGLWQVSARREADFDRWVEANLEYIDRWSFWLDLKIMALTVPAVLGGGGR
jgi:putative transposase